MCVIVDADCLHHLIRGTEIGRPVLRWLVGRSRKAGLIVGGKLYEELRRSGFDNPKNASFRETLRVLSEAGRLHRFIGPEVEKKAKELEVSNLCKSNDQHVVALTIISRCTVVFSHDASLAKDLKNRAIIGHRVSVYKTEAHRALLRTCHCSPPNAQ
jgi:hypothetical protein